MKKTIKIGGKLGMKPTMIYDPNKKPVKLVPEGMMTGVTDPPNYVEPVIHQVGSPVIEQSPSQKLMSFGKSKNHPIPKIPQEEVAKSLGDYDAGPAHPLASFKGGLKPGLYRIFWKSGGHSDAAIGMLPNGNRWIAPINWSAPCMDPESDCWDGIEVALPLEATDD